MKTTFRKTAGYGLITLAALAIGFSACKKDKASPKVATLTTNAITDNLSAAVDAAGLIVYPNATTGGTITSNGGSEITESGICWSTENTAPNTADNIISSNPIVKTGSFTIQMANLLPATKYYARAYAINAKGTSYGTTQTFTTVGVADADANVYNTIVIGTQTWMLENLKTTKYNDGTDIPYKAAADTWANLATDAFCWYATDEANKNIYGGLYNWYAVNKTDGNGKNLLAPAGFHIPTTADWTTLNDFLGNNLSVEGDKLREVGNTHWTASAGITATNSSGFNALPAGSRTWNGDTFSGLNVTSYFWIAGEDVANQQIHYYRLNHNSSAFTILSQALTLKNVGLSVRCVKD